MFKNDTNILENFKVEEINLDSTIEIRNNPKFKSFLGHLETILSGKPADKKTLAEITQSIDTTQIKDEEQAQYTREALRWATLYNNYLRENKGLGQNILSTKPRLKPKTEKFLKYFKNTYTP